MKKQKQKTETILFGCLPNFIFYVSLPISFVLSIFVIIPVIGAIIENLVGQIFPAKTLDTIWQVLIVGSFFLTVILSYWVTVITVKIFKKIGG